VTVEATLSPRRAIEVALDKVISKYSMLKPALINADYRFRINSFWTFIVPMIMNIPIFTG